MRLDRAHRIRRSVQRPVVGAIAGLMVFTGVLTANVQADPADDALAKLNELSRQAEQTTEAMHSAQLDLNDKLAIQQAADAKHAADVAAADTAKAQLATFQSAVDKFAAAQYMGGRTDGSGRAPDRGFTAEAHRPARRAAGDGHRDVGADGQLPQHRRTGRAGRGSLRKVGGRGEDRRRAGRRSARRPAIQAKSAAVEDRRRQVAVPGPDPAPAGGAGGSPAGRAAAHAASRTACAPHACGIAGTG